MKHLFFSILYSVILSSCNIKLSAVDIIGGDQTSRVYPSKITKCKVEVSLTDANTEINIHAKYTAKISEVNGENGSNPIFIGADSVEDKNIRYADYRVLNSSGKIVHCGNTSGDGEFNFTLNKSSDYSLIIYSYILKPNTDVANINVAVMNSPSEGLPYFVKKSFSTDNSGRSKSLNLTATLPENDNTKLNTNNSGAFNILDQIVESNLFLKQNVGSNFTNTTPLEVYWKSGLNPGSYVDGETAPAVSFFLKNNNHSRIFILGGMNGDTGVSDTDEFDNSVIIHEYSHFLLSTFSKDNSPGGRHSGVESIDPRLAWSEGFANFFQASVLNKSFYLDVVGAGGANLINLEKENGVDSPSINGEGNYREFSIARFFWDIVDSPSSDDDRHFEGYSNFKLIWDVVSSENFKSEVATSMGLFNEVQNFNFDTKNFSSLRSRHRQNSPANEFFRSLYAFQLGNDCSGQNNNLKFTQTQHPADENNILQRKRVLEYNQIRSGNVLFGLKFTETNKNIKFYIQNFRKPMNNSIEESDINYTRKSSNNADCQASNYKQCLNVNLDAGKHLIEVVLQNRIDSDLDFQFFANETQLCGENTTYETALNKPAYLNKKNVNFYKLTAPFDLDITALKHGQVVDEYQLTATFTNQNLNLDNIQLDWLHSDNIKIISGNLKEQIASAKPNQKITIKLVIKALDNLDNLDKVKIYLSSKASYKNRNFSKTLAFTLKQLINKSTKKQNLLFKTNKILKKLKNETIYY
ncbi:MAG: hypothetical protein HAW60_04005 [Bdellovibrionales bacterium]|nr:hypothetical protein [Bdellovibrionales bacterium]